MALNHAFLITAHAYPKLLKDIIGLLSAPNHYFFINVDRKTEWGFKFIDENRSDHVFFLEGNDRMEVAHGGYSQIAVTLRLLHAAYKHSGGGISYFHLISGQDFPVHSNKKFDDFFEKNEGRSFMEIESVAFNNECMKKKYPSRVLPYFFIDIPHRDNRLVNFMVRGINFISRRIWWRKPIPGLWGGWNWFSWHRSLAQYVIEKEKNDIAYFKRFHHTYCADELIFQTLFHSHEEELNIDGMHSLRYINWNKMVEGRSHIGSPLTLNEDEYEDIIRSGAFFCRKVHPEISKVLLEKLRKNITV